MDDKITILEGDGYLSSTTIYPLLHYTRERVEDPGSITVTISWLQLNPVVNLPTPVFNGQRYHFILTAEPVIKDRETGC